MKRPKATRWSAVIAMAGAGALPALQAADWTAWRGPAHDGISTESPWDPPAIKDGATILWKTNVGAGYSAVATAGERLYTMGNQDGRDSIWCLDARDGSTLWRHAYDCKPGNDYPGPRATPVLDGKAVYAVSREGHVWCLDAGEGTVHWSVQIRSEFGALPPGWGHSGSVLVTGRLAVLNAGQHGLALDKLSGKKVWASPSDPCSYATPVPRGKVSPGEVVIFGAKAVFGVDARDGRRLWSFPWKTSYDVNAADPLLVGEDVFLTSGYGTGCARLRVKPPEAEVVWQNKRLKAHFGTPVYLDGAIYGVDGQAGRGALVCLDAGTGDLKWSQPLGFGSLVATAKHLIFLSEKGELVIAEASPDQYREVARAQVMSRPKCWTMPVLSNGRIYCRNDRGDLVCVQVAPR